MRIRELLAALARRWAEVNALLRPQEAGRLGDLVAAFVAEAIPNRVHRRAEDIVDLLTEHLPDGHPLLLILEEPTTRLANPSTDHVELAAWQTVAAALRVRLPEQRPAPTVEQVAAGASAWLLAAPALTEDQVRARGHNPDDPHLIRLDRPDGGAQWPAFQFHRPGTVHWINTILHADDDPWGAADWWLGENSWLGGVPAELFERDGVSDDELVAAAHDELAEG